MVEGNDGERRTRRERMSGERWEINTSAPPSPQLGVAASSPVTRNRRFCVGPVFFLGIAPFVILICAMILWVFTNEAHIVCHQIAFLMITSQVREAPCKLDASNINSLVHMTCPLSHRGATDPGTGLHTDGYKIEVQSRMLQWRERIHMKKQTGPTLTAQGAVRPATSLTPAKHAHRWHIGRASPNARSPPPGSHLAVLACAATDRRIATPSAGPTAIASSVCGRTS